MSLSDLIQYEQEEVTHRLKTIKAPTYDNTILPSVNKLIQELEKTNFNNYPTKVSILKPIDIYLETLTCLYIKNPTVNIPLSLLTLIVLYRPYMLQLLQIKHNSDSWEMFCSSMLECIASNYDQLPQSKEIRKILENKRLQSVSAFQYFHYLMGFYFKSQFIAQEKQNLKDEIYSLAKLNNVKELILIAINAQNGIKNKDSIIIYNNVPRTKQMILNEDTIKDFNSFQYANTTNTDTPFNIYDINFKQLSDIPSTFTHSLVLINYDNIHYTIAYFGKNSVLDKTYTQNFISGKCLKSVNVQLLTFYLQQSFYSSIYTNDLSIDELKRTYTKLMNITSAVFNRTTKETFVDELMKETEDIIDEHEKVYFKIYLSKVPRLPTYDLSNVLNYVLSYIYPDLLITSNEL